MVYGVQLFWSTTISVSSFKIPKMCFHSSRTLGFWVKSFTLIKPSGPILFGKDICVGLVPLTIILKKEFVNSLGEFCCSSSHPHHSLFLWTLDCLLLLLLHSYPTGQPEQEPASPRGLAKTQMLGPLLPKLLIRQVKGVAWGTAFLTGFPVMLCCWSSQHAESLSYIIPPFPFPLLFWILISCSP